MNDKSKYHPNIHHRRSIRLKGYDYSQAGLYFITICCQDRMCRFGDVVNEEMILNDAGNMVNKWYYELENKFTDIRCHEMIVMPNHFHGILENVGADLRVCPDSNNDNANTIEGEHVGSPLHRVVQWFKTMTTNEYIRGVKTMGWIPFNGKLWQRNYWEHIIRNEKSYQTISDYIINNPAKWINDKFYIK
jgi:REP element-mobilizing transposase RayT